FLPKNFSRPRKMEFQISELESEMTTHSEKIEQLEEKSLHLEKTSIEKLDQILQKLGILEQKLNTVENHSRQNFKTVMEEIGILTLAKIQMNPGRAYK